ncbi:MAG: 16S rRNA (uracil(1498)-N(3))-methyltransferase [Bacteroidetes bacterium]|nr:MAG: 16S rRNA (uracil(1498)-N(3))-methyltransferase [Bacteroidota bacterium]
MHIFYEENLQNALVKLSPEESRHCTKVLRLKAGDEVGFTDGKGTFARARLVDVNAKSTTAAITHRELKPKRNFHLHMVVAPTKNIDRFEWFLEKATECGIEEVTPIICAQSERTVVKPERLKKIMLSAIKQSQRAWLPRLNDTVKFKDFINNYSSDTPSFIAHCDEGEKNPLRDAYNPGKDVMIMIGPEGDFSPEEVQLARDKGIQAISLGQNRLRTETAALVACVAVSFMNGEL